MHGGKMSTELRAGAVVVFYNPDAACVERANRLAKQLRCVVVDNSPTMRGAKNLGLAESIEYLPNGENKGIGAALNRGVAALIDEGYEAAFVFDQDSEPSPMLLTELSRVIAKANIDFVKIALAGPAYDDARLGGVAPFVRFRVCRLERVTPAGHDLIDVDFLITSGSCINLRYWAEIGGMDESLFIDFVDLEWCVRAKYRGFRVVGVPWVTMQHELGEEPVRILGRTYPMHNPLRHYYLFRNAVALFRRGYVPWQWKSSEVLKLPVRLAIYALFPKQAKEHWRMAWRGLLDGLRGKAGPYSR
ncbi:glycosyltransferase family 2 protein [Burkholderia sp. SCN-KJ]|nr:glycosyltransferase family 2 protein [Burkholderia sp. SCN-KJ]MCR4464979.1 glycosyltransferase family 2 protein [Burkholderia sp. SCN-KJ]